MDTLNTRYCRVAWLPSNRGRMFLLGQPYVTLMMEALGTSETSVLSRATRRNFPEDSILQLYCTIITVLICSIFLNRSDDTSYPSLLERRSDDIISVFT
jgi:hypothetical protein